MNRHRHLFKHFTRMMKNVWFCISLVLALPLLTSAAHAAPGQAHLVQDLHASACTLALTAPTAYAPVPAGKAFVFHGDSISPFVEATDGSQQSGNAFCRIDAADVPASFATLSGELYFTSVRGGSLIRSDGTTPGTVGIARTFDAPLGVWAIGDAICFARKVGQDAELLRVDAAGATSLLHTFTGTFQALYCDGQQLYFQVYASPSGQLWKSDGTEAGTVAIGPIEGYPPSPQWVRRAGNYLVECVAADHQYTFYPQLYAISLMDATVNTIPTYPIGDLFNPVVLNDTVYVLGNDAVGMVLKVDIASSRLVQVTGEWYSHKEALVAFGNGFIFANRSGGTRQIYHLELNSTTPVVCWQGAVSGDDPVSLFANSSRAVFATTGNLFCTDGTSTGTHQIATGARGPLTIWNDRALYTGNDHAVWSADLSGAGAPYRITNSTSRARTEDSNLRYLANSSGAGLFAVTDPDPIYGSLALHDTLLAFYNTGALQVLADLGSQITSQLPFAGKLWLSTESGIAWATDASPQGTSELPFQVSSFGVAHDGKAWFAAKQQPTNYADEPWVTDGTAEGTTQIADLNTAEETTCEEWYYNPLTGNYYCARYAEHQLGSDPHAFSELSDKVAFMAKPTSDGYQEVLFVAPYSGAPPQPIQPTPFTVWGAVTPYKNLGLLFSTVFPPGEPVDGMGLNALQGTTVQLLHRFRDLPSPTFQAGPGGMYFAADDGLNGIELWRTNGKAKGTRLVKNIAPSGESSSPHDFFPCGKYLLFAANGGAQSGVELWRTNGAAKRTVMVKELAAGGYSSSPANFSAFGTRVLFTADDPDHGRELYMTDGSEAGTVLLKDIAPGPFSSAPDQFTVVGNHVLFTAEDIQHGRELWITDGTPVGTHLYQDLNTGITSSNPHAFAVVGDKVVFACDGNDGLDFDPGVELWSIDTSAAPLE